jgi:hypothetical protein
MIPGQAVFELGNWHACDGRAPMTDAARIARAGAMHGRNPGPLPDHLALLMYIEGYKAGTEDKQVLPPDAHDYLTWLDGQVT